MPATRIQVFRDPTATLPASAAVPSTPRRVSSRVNATTASAINATTTKGISTRRSVQARNTFDGTSLITTNVSSITIDDKENRDPVTGLPLSSLLAGGKGKKSSAIVSAGGQKYIATTITTTVLSPLPTITKSASRRKVADEDEGGEEKTRKARVALGVVKKPTNTPAFRSLADADTEDEDDAKMAQKPKARPRRSLRLAAANDSVPVDAAAAASSSSTTGKAIKKSTKAKRVADASSTVTAAAGGARFSSSSSSNSASSKAKKLALAKHTAAVVAAAVEAQEHAMSAQLLTPSDSSPDSINVMRVSPVKPAVRRSPRTSMPSASTSTPMSSSLSTLAGGVRAFEVFSPLSTSIGARPLTSPTTKGALLSPARIALPPSSSPSLSGGSEDDEDMDVDADLMDDCELAIEMADAEDAANTAAALQRIIDQRCKDLTILPLANVSAAYGASSVSSPLTADGTML